MCKGLQVQSVTTELSSRNEEKGVHAGGAGGRECESTDCPLTHLLGSAGALAHAMSSSLAQGYARSHTAPSSSVCGQGPLLPGQALVQQLGSSPLLVRDRA